MDEVKIIGRAVQKHSNRLPDESLPDNPDYEPVIEETYTDLTRRMGLIP
jgi:hypothetical protein